MKTTLSLGPGWRPLEKLETLIEVYKNFWTGACFNSVDLLSYSLFISYSAKFKSLPVISVVDTPLVR